FHLKFMFMFVFVQPFNILSASILCLVAEGFLDALKFKIIQKTVTDALRALTIGHLYHEVNFHIFDDIIREYLSGAFSAPIWSLGHSQQSFFGMGQPIVNMQSNSFDWAKKFLTSGAISALSPTAAEAVSKHKQPIMVELNWKIPMLMMMRGLDYLLYKILSEYNMHRNLKIL
ncbi:hypothetical protein ACJX0J_021169, partial [Zea mays]